MGKIDTINENAISAFNRIRQKHGFKENVLTPKKIDKLFKDILERDVEKDNEATISIYGEVTRESFDAVKEDRVFDILRFIDEQPFSNNIKAALGIILSGEISEIPKVIEYLQKELEK